MRTRGGMRAEAGGYPLCPRNSGGLNPLVRGRREGGKKKGSVMLFVGMWHTFRANAKVRGHTADQNSTHKHTCMRRRGPLFARTHKNYNVGQRGTGRNRL